MTGGACTSCARPLDDNASFSEEGLICQSCALLEQRHEGQPDAAAEGLRRCPHCGDSAATLIRSVAHVRTVYGAEAGTQGHSFEYDCPSCQRGFTLLSRRRRLWMFYGVAVGALCCAGAYFAGDVGIVLGLVGVIAMGVSGGLLIRDSSLRRRTELPASDR